jgi:hypothetical protein
VERDAERKIQNAKQNFERKLTKEEHRNSRPFFSDIKCKTKGLVMIGPLTDKQNKTVVGEEKMADILNDYLPLSSQMRAMGNRQTKSRWRGRHSWMISRSAQKKWFKSIRELRSTTAPGPDKVGQHCCRS